MKIDFVKKGAVALGCIVAITKPSGAFIQGSNTITQITSVQNKVKMQQVKNQIDSKSELSSRINSMLDNRHKSVLKSEKSEYLNDIDNNRDKEFNDACLIYDSSGNYKELVKLIKNNNSKDSEYIKSFIEDNKLLHEAFKRNHKEFAIELLKTKVNVNQQDEMGRTPLHFAVQSDVHEFTRLLITKGAEVNIPDNLQHTPLSLALKFKNIKATGDLLVNGAYLVGINRGDLINNGINSDSFRIYLNTKMYLQANNIITGGIYPSFQPMYKQILIKSIIDKVSKKDAESMLQSNKIDFALHSSKVSKEKKHEIIKNCVMNLKPENFIWLSGGTHDHAIDMIVKRNEKGNISLTISNRGLGINKYHKMDEYKRVYHKTITFDAPDKFNSLQDRYKFDSQVVQALTEIIDGVDNRKEFFSVDKYYSIVDKVLNYKPYLKQFSKEESDKGQPMTPQFADNCGTMSMVGALAYIYPDKVTFEKLKSTWIDYLESEIKTLAPNVSTEDLKNMIKKSENIAPEEYMLNRATILYEHTKNNELTIKEKSEFLKEALFYYGKYLEKFMKMHSKVTDGNYSNVVEFLHDRIEKCKDELRYNFYWEDRKNKF